MSLLGKVVDNEILHYFYIACYIVEVKIDIKLKFLFFYILFVACINWHITLRHTKHTKLFFTFSSDYVVPGPTVQT